MSRYVVTELEGWAITARNLTQTGRLGKHPGLSCQVLDTAANYRLVASYRTEDQRGQNSRSREARREFVRRQAREHADRLNLSDNAARV